MLIGMARPKNSNPGETRERILAFVRKRLLEGASPTVREVQQAFKFRAVGSAQAHLDALVEEGRLHKAASQVRGFRLPEVGSGVRPSFLVPVVGRVQAGALTLALEENDGFVAVEARRGYGPQSDLFSLWVRGDSMTGAGIMPGDLVIVRRQRTADSGDIVVALVGNEATVKRLRLGQKNRVELLPENPEHKTIVIEPPDELTLLGKVLEVRRYLDGRRA